MGEKTILKYYKTKDNRQDTIKYSLILLKYKETCIFGFGKLKIGHYQGGFDAFDKVR